MSYIVLTKQLFSEILVGLKKFVFLRREEGGKRATSLHLIWMAAEVLRESLTHGNGAICTYDNDVIAQFLEGSGPAQTNEIV